MYSGGVYPSYETVILQEPLTSSSWSQLKLTMSSRSPVFCGLILKDAMNVPLACTSLKCTDTFHFNGKEIITGMEKFRKFTTVPKNGVF